MTPGPMHLTMALAWALSSPSHSRIVLKYLNKHCSSVAGSLTTTLHLARATFYQNRQKYAVSSYQLLEGWEVRRMGGEGWRRRAFLGGSHYLCSFLFAAFCQGIITPFRFSPSSYTLIHRYHWPWVLNLGFPAV